MGPDLQKFQPKKNSQISHFFEGEKSLDMSRGFRPWATHPVKKQFEYLRGPTPPPSHPTPPAVHY